MAPSNYETKFASFIEMCRQAKQNKIPNVIIAHPQVLGDNYEEIVESLTRLTEAKLTLQITSR